VGGKIKLHINSRSKRNRATSLVYRPLGCSCFRSESQTLEIRSLANPGCFSLFLYQAAAQRRNKKTNGITGNMFSSNAAAAAASTTGTSTVAVLGLGHLRNHLQKDRKEKIWNGTEWESLKR
jgi:hypothetical protein